MLRALRTLPLLTLAACGFAACGGADDHRPSAEKPFVSPPEECAHGDEYAASLTPITAFEVVNNSLVCGSADTFWCTSYQNQDGLHSPPDGGDCKELIYDGQVVQSGVVETITRTPETTERCGASTEALHFKATNLGMCKGTNGRLGWGGGYEIDFTSDRAGNTKAPIDASGYDGVSFWIKRGTGKTGGAIIVLVVDSFAAGGVDEVDPENGAVISCKATDPAVQPLPEPDNQKCDPFSAGVSLPDDWTFVPLRFADLRQKGFGAYAPDGFKPQELLRLQFLVNAGDWDFWIDDISFFNDP